MSLAGGKPEKNPSVAVWLKYYDKDLYEAIDDQGIIGILKPRFGNPLTFLYPAEKSYRDNIIKKLNGADATIGVHMVQALVIVRENLTDPQEWLDRKDNIPNALGQKVELSADSTNKNVVLANGATLTINKDFASRENNITVWDYKGKAEMPLDGKTADFIKRAPKPVKKLKKTGGSGFPVYPQKCILAKHLENQALCLIKSGGKEHFEKTNPYSAAMVSLAQYLCAKKSDSLDTFNLLCEYNAVSAFYAAVLPYTTGSLIESSVEEWLKDTRGVCLESNPNEAWISYVKGLKDCGDKMCEKLSAAKQSLSDEALKSTAIGLYKNCFGNDAMLRLKGDEIRFIIHTTMAKNSLKEQDMSQLFLDIQVVYSPDKSESFFFADNTRLDATFNATAKAFFCSRCCVSVPNPKCEGEKVTFNEMASSDKSIDEDSFVTDDEYYEKLTESSSEADFISGLKKVIQSMPSDMKKKLIDEISAL